MIGKKLKLHPGFEVSVTSHGCGSFEREGHETHDEEHAERSERKKLKARASRACVDYGCHCHKHHEGSSEVESLPLFLFELSH